MGSNSHAPAAGKLQVLGPKGPLLTNRMSELFTYGSVGGVGGNSGPYPAAADVLPQGGPHPLSQRTGRNAQLLPPRSRVNYHFPWSAEFFGSTGVGFHLSGRCSRRRLLPACHVKGFFPQLKKYWKKGVRE